MPTEGNVVVYDVDNFSVTSAEKEILERDGCFAVRNFFSPTQIQHVRESLYTPDWDEQGWNMSDGSELYMWNQPGNDVTGLVARSERLVGVIEDLLGGEVYHYYSAAFKKVPYWAQTRQSMPWHQDFAFWHDFGCPKPGMATVSVCLDPVDRRNGALQAWLGTTRDECLPTKEINGTLVADPDHVARIEETLPLAHIELSPGDIFIRNCKLLHASGKNETDARRTELLFTYNRADNSPPYFNSWHHSCYTPIDVVPNSRVWGSRVTGLGGKDFILPGCSPTLKALLYRVGFH